jgi:ribonuclease E
MHGANFAIEKSSAPVAPQKAPERTAAVNMAWGFEGQDAEEAPREEAEPRHTESEGESEGEGRRSRRRRRRGRGRGEDRGEQRGRGEHARFATNGEADESQANETQDARDHGPDEGYTDAAEGIPGVGEQPSVPFGDDKGEERRGRSRRRGRRGGRRGRDRDAPRHSDDPTTRSSNGSDLDSPEHVADADGPREELAPEPAHIPERVHEEPAHTVHDREARWSTPVEVVRTAEEPEVARNLAPLPAASEERQRQPTPSEPPAEDDDPSRPVRKGWWQRRFTGD